MGVNGPNPPMPNVNKINNLKLINKKLYKWKNVWKKKTKKY